MATDYMRHYHCLISNDASIFFMHFLCYFLLTMQIALVKKDRYVSLSSNRLLLCFLFIILLAFSRVPHVWVPQMPYSLSLSLSLSHTNGINLVLFCLQSAPCTGSKICIYVSTIILSLFVCVIRDIQILASEKKCINIQSV